jgi:hypothetical protein
MTFSDWQKQEASGYRKGDYELVKKAKDGQQAIIDEFKNEFAPADLQNARQLWAQSSALDKVDRALKTKSVLQPTPANLRPTGVPDQQVINGKNFAKAVADLKNKGTLQAAGLTHEHITALQDLGTLLEKGENVHKLSRLVAGGGALAEALGLVTHPVAAATAAGAAIPGYVVSRLLGRVMTDPTFAAKVVKGLQVGQRVAPAATANLYRQTAGALSGSSATQ